MVTLGIDFGTSNTVAVVGLDDGRAVPLLFGETPLLPSAVCVTQGGELLVGRDAVRASRSRPEAFEQHPKSRIDDGEVLLGDRAVPVAELIGAVLRRVHDEAVRVAGVAVDRLVLTHPAGWGARRRQTLLEAAAIAGLPPVGLVAEPVAAAAYYLNFLGHAVLPGRCLMVYDFGAGTFDASVVRRTADGFEVLSEEGILDAGGLDVDAAIVAYLGAIHGADNPEGWRRLTAPAAPVDQRMSRAFWDDVRTGKEELSRTSMTTIFVPILELEAVLGREQLDHLARPLLDRTVAATRLAIRSAGIRVEEIAAVFLVGGSSRMSLAATLLHQSLGVAPTVIEQPELIVASGTLRIDRAEALTAEPTSKDEVPEPVPLAASRRTVAQQPAPHTPAPGLPDLPTPTSPVPVSPAPVSQVSQLRDLAGHDEHGQGGEAELGAGRPVQAAVQAQILEALELPESHAESIEPPLAGNGLPDTTAEAVTPTVGMFGRRVRRYPGWLAGAVGVAIVAVVAVVALQGDPFGTGSGPVPGPTQSVKLSPTRSVTSIVAPVRVATLTDHTSTVNAVAFSPDGKTMATGSRDNTVIMWDVTTPATPRRLTTLRDHTSTVKAVAFSGDGKTMATGSYDTVIVWDVSVPAAPRSLATITGSLGGLTVMALSPDGKTIAAGSSDKAVIVWDVSVAATPRRLATLTDHTGSLEAVAFSPDGKTMATGSSDKTVIVWDVSVAATPRRLATLTNHTGSVDGVAFSPDGKTMVTGSEDKTVIVWDVSAPATPRRLATLTDHTGAVFAVAFSPDGKTMAAGGEDKTVIVWDVSVAATPRRLATLTDHTGAVFAVAFSPDGKTMAASSIAVIVWRTHADE
ncbi:Hsp70 family protein [Dactylosporangium sp. McL0621]|uniref:Hsp70 family protein n=1 Tax=Dactylosporangium sp. McL0621 TaxID=3415678 RepID=UPI003CEB220B